MSIEGAWFLWSVVALVLGVLCIVGGSSEERVWETYKSYRAVVWITVAWVGPVLLVALFKILVASCLT